MILTYALLCIGGLLILGSGMDARLFTSPGRIDVYRPDFYFRLVSYIAGHAGWQHLTGNLMMILLVGPLLEEKYGSGRMLEMILLTAVVTAVLNCILFHTSIMGASGIAFMLILLSSFVNIRSREIPMTFLIIAVLFIGSELVSSFRPDRISQFSHMAGGFIGAGYGFLRNRRS